MTPLEAQCASYLRIAEGLLKTASNALEEAALYLEDDDLGLYDEAFDLREMKEQADRLRKELEDK